MKVPKCEQSLHRSNGKEATVSISCHFIRVSLTRGVLVTKSSILNFCVPMALNFTDIIHPHLGLYWGWKMRTERNSEDHSLRFNLQATPRVNLFQEKCVNYEPAASEVCIRCLCRLQDHSSAHLPKWEAARADLWCTVFLWLTEEYTWLIPTPQSRVSTRKCI